MNDDMGACHHLDGGLFPRVEAWVHAVTMNGLHHYLGIEPDRPRVGFTLECAQMRDAQDSFPLLHEGAWARGVRG